MFPGRLPPGFCRGDMHNGNMIRTPQGMDDLRDFDKAALVSPMVDAGNLSDAADYFCVSPQGYDTVSRLFPGFLPGLSPPCLPLR